MSCAVALKSTTMSSEFHSWTFDQHMPYQGSSLVHFWAGHFFVPLWRYSRLR